ncbi:type VI secretion system Vgr family protein [Psychrobacter aestuarii]|uniref:type VI secretion system Vgr family protein n=2 Tax=Psychrobacter aestuarii TaxID=556327 RepID=UPI001918D890|nr:type VI secretion system Vgr family protein [Psychrobacter aestuarii]
MVWTQAHRYLQLRSAQTELAQSIISEAFLLESLLGADIPDAAYQETAALPAPEHYPSPYHQDLRRLSYKARTEALFCGYRYVITLVNERAGLSVASWIGQALSLHWQTGSMLTPNQVRHGIITEAIALGSNGGMATYRIVVEPALYQLRLSAHNRRHHHLSLAALVEDIVSPFGFDITMSDALKDCHIQHSVQYNQTDLAYLQQHLQRFGITGYYEHSDSAHILVLVRHDDKALHPDGDDIIDTLSQNPASMADTQDRITMLRPQTSGHVKETHLHRYDNRLRDRYSGSHQSDTKQDSAHQRYLHSHTHMDSDALEQLAQRQQYYYEQRAYQGELQGNIRHLQLPHSYHVAGNPFVTEPISISAICHKIDNHLPVEWLGQSYIDPTTLQPKQRGKAKLAKTDHTHHLIAHYQPHPYHHHIPYGQQLTRLGQAHPSLHGLMSASIIAEGNQGITTDRNHRAHIRYHWQHEDDMSMDDSAQWVPIASHLVADHMGQTHPLRHGQHVLIDFIGGDITHPVIVGSTHNGQGNPDAQHNSITSDSDAIDATSPTWFINQSHNHPIDGIKTQSIDSSRTGDATKDSSTNGYNQLMFDLYSGSEQISLYSSSHHSMNLGQLYQQTDHTRGQARGQGISIETQAAGSLQGSTGIYISSDNSKGHMSHQSHSQLQTADQQQQAYATLASTHHPVGLKDNSEPPMEDGETPYAKVSKDSTDNALNDAGAWQQPHILIHAQHDMGIFTGQHRQQTSMQTRTVMPQRIRITTANRRSIIWSRAMYSTTATKPRRTPPLMAIWSSKRIKTRCA